MQDNDLFQKLKNSILNIDPVVFCEENLTLDGQQFRINGNGYKPFADIYRYIALTAVEPDSKPIVLVKGRQVGATTMAAALESYFVSCGLYGTGNRHPIRIMHLFPTLGLAAAYTKSKLEPIIYSSKPVPGVLNKKGIQKTFLESKIDTSSPSNDNMFYKKFIGNNEIWIDSTGPDGDRIRGRMLNLETELPTPDRGFIKLKDLKEGDKLFDDQGNICTCTKLHPICESPESYKITFDDGTTIDACAEHLWLTYTKKDRNVNRINNSKMKRRNLRRSEGIIHKPYLENNNDLKPNPTIKTTKEILDTLMYGNEYNHSIPVIPHAKYAEKELPIDPYILGLWLGDGTSNGGIITSADPEILEGYNHYLIKSSAGVYNPSLFSKDGYTAAVNYRIPGLTTSLQSLNLIKNKHIPDIYLNSSYEQRLSLLQGLMDTDGCCYKDGRCEFSQIVDREKLVFQIKDLISSLGIKCRLIKKQSFRYEKQYKDKYLIIFSTNKPVFRLKRKLEKLNLKETTKKTHRFIRSIEPIEPVRMRCITVDSPSHLYLVTRSYIPTHNTVDIVMFDECFPYDQLIDTSIGPVKIGKLYEMYSNNIPLPLVNSFNEKTKAFELKTITKAWNRGVKNLIQINANNRKIKCTPNHRLLTQRGWVAAEDLELGDLLVTTNKCKKDFESYGLIPIKSVTPLKEEAEVFDIEVCDNHNFVALDNVRKLSEGIVAHNCQDNTEISIGAVTKILTKSHYGAIGSGIQVYFGTPKTKGGHYYKKWINSTQKYYHLKCEKCNEYFPLYRPDVNWEDIWLYGFIVKCTHCGFEQDKNEASERGKWIAFNKDKDAKMEGYHINQLYIPDFPKEFIIAQKPENSTNNTERIYMNEVLGEFFDGEGGTITKQEILDNCLDKDRKFAANISPNIKAKVYAGFDWGHKSALDAMVNRKAQGQSFSCGVVIIPEGPELFTIQFATRFLKNDIQSKLDTVDEMFRRYSISLAVGDIGDAKDMTELLQEKYGDVFLASRSSPRVTGHVTFNDKVFPKEIQFEKDYYIDEFINLLRKGAFRFPGGSYYQIEWLIDHCCSMEIKATLDRSGGGVKHFVKGSGPNDGLMALLNAYLAWKFDVTGQFKQLNPAKMKHGAATKASEIPAVLGYSRKW